jgi:hypothetical protein
MNRLAAPVAQMEGHALAAEGVQSAAPAVSAGSAQLAPATDLRLGGVRIAQDVSLARARHAFQLGILNRGRPNDAGLVP